ncbi:hypothetical protein AUI46_03255 [archaeon 13_1_40CM_2_52_13]|nr:MAG: hypothetical protein AUI46_03255 [archaeon 13_1_40CM_2_52_13]
MEGKIVQKETGHFSGQDSFRIHDPESVEVDWFRAVLVRVTGAFLQSPTGPFHALICWSPPKNTVPGEIFLLKIVNCTPPGWDTKLAVGGN